LLFILPPHTTMMKKPIKLVRSTVINHDTANDNTRSDGDDNDDKENQPDNDQLDTISLKPQHKLLSIDIEPYLEEYLADNYFKIHQFKSFQKQGNKKRCCFVYYNAHTINTLLQLKAGCTAHSITQRCATGPTARLSRISQPSLLNQPSL